MEYFSNIKPELVEDNVNNIINNKFFSSDNINNKNLINDIKKNIVFIYYKFFHNYLPMYILFILLILFFIYRYKYMKKSKKKRKNTKYSNKEKEVLKNIKNKYNIDYDQIINKEYINERNNMNMSNFINNNINDLKYDNNNLNYNNVMYNNNQGQYGTVINNNTNTQNVDDIYKNEDVMDYIESQNNQKLWNESSKKDLGDYNLDNDDEFKELLDRAKKDPDILKDYLDTYVEPPYQI